MFFTLFKSVVLSRKRFIRIKFPILTHSKYSNLIHHFSKILGLFHLTSAGVVADLPWVVGDHRLYRDQHANNHQEG